MIKNTVEDMFNTYLFKDINDIITDSTVNQNRYRGDVIKNFSSHGN
jgi:hypothetical protein